MEKAAAALAAAGRATSSPSTPSPGARAAVKGRGEGGLKILGVTVLTSLSQDDLAQIGYALTVEALVERRIRQVIEAGPMGVVASRTRPSSPAASAVRRAFWW